MSRHCALPGIISTGKEIHYFAYIYIRIEIAYRNHMCFLLRADLSCLDEPLSSDLLKTRCPATHVHVLSLKLDACMEEREGETLIFHARARDRRPQRGQSEDPSSVRLVGPSILGSLIPIKEKDEYGLIHRELWKVVVVIIVHGSSFNIAEIGSPPFQR